MSALYDRIETLCLERGMTITAMCAELSISRASLSDFKSGRSRSLSMDTIAKIAEYFSVSADYLLTGRTDRSDQTDGADNLQPICGYHTFTGTGFPKIPDFTVYWKCDRKDLFAYTYPAGDVSMAPRLQSGDILIFTRTDRVDTQGIYLFITEDGNPQIRETQLLMGQFVLRAWNTDVPLEIQQDMTVLGKAVGMYTIFDRNE